MKLKLLLALVGLAAVAVVVGFARSSKPAQAATPALEVEVVSV